MKVAIGQINSKIGDFEGNRDKILDYSVKAAALKADIVVFPEMSLCGYPPMDLLDHPTFIAENKKALRWLQKHLPKDICVVLGYVSNNPSQKGKGLQNFGAAIYNNEIIHRQAKTLLPSYDVFDETRYFEPAEEQTVFTFKGKKIGLAICEDIWWESEVMPGSRYPVDPVNNLLDQGCQMLFVLSASPYHSGKKNTRLSLAARASKLGGIPLVYSNVVGANDNLIFDGSSFITDSSGQLVTQCVSFEEDLQVLDFEKDHESLELQEDRWEDMKQSLVLGVRDYFKKCGFHKAHLGLSGGIDSALVLVIAAEALGAENIMTFGLPSRYSSDGSLTDARQLAENLGVKFEVLPIENEFKSFLNTLAPIFQGKDEDVTEENIQARIRGVLLMSYSNKFRSLLLTTGNKSELAVGYCTLYGDMSGGLSVIGDLLKTEVFDLCRYINKDKEIIPDSIITKPPSAELKPDQQDSDSLPPYEVLDDILVKYLIEYKTAEQIIAEGHSEETVRRILRLVALSEYKRMQAAPILKVSQRAFGNGRRMPIARTIYESHK